MGQRTTEPPISWLMHAALSRPKLISLAAGFTDNASLPVAEARTALNQVLRSPKTGQPALQYGINRRGSGTAPTDGGAFAETGLLGRDAVSAFPKIRDARHAVPSRNLFPERLLITSGSQQLLYLTAEALCDEGDIVLVEDPTYFVFLGILQSRGLRARAVRLERDGLDLAHLEKVLTSLKRSGELRRVKMFYLVSYFQNPTGVTTSFEKKRGLLKLLKKFERAAGHPIYLLEDAAYRELRFPVGRLPVASAGRRPCHSAVGAGRARRGGAGDLRGHLQQAICDRRARGLRHFARAAVHGGEAHQGQPRFRHVQPAATSRRPRTGVGNLRAACRAAAKALRAQGARDEAGD